MRRSLFLIAAMLSFNGCTTRDALPTEGEMDRVEAMLAGNDCIGDPGGWTRHYYFHPRYFGDEVEAAAREGRAPRSSGHIRSMIGFDLRAGDGGGEMPVRRAIGVPPADASAPAQAGERRALGHFDLSTGKLAVARCDPKMLP